MKKIATILLSAVILAAGTVTPVLAKPNPNPEFTIVSPAAYETIQGGYSRISDNGNGTVQIYGYTRAYYPVDQIGITFNIQYYNSTQGWVTLNTYTYNNFVASEITKNFSVEVTPGYTYRLANLHYTYNNGIKETGMTTTQGIDVQ